MSDELKGFTNEYSKQMLLHIEELAAAFVKKTNLPPDKCKLVQLQSMDFPNYKLTSWFEPLENEEAEIYRKRAETAEIEVERLKERNAELEARLDIYCGRKFGEACGIINKLNDECIKLTAERDEARNIARWLYHK